MFFARKKRDAAMKDTIDRLGAVREALRVLRVREAALIDELDAYRPADYVRAGAYQMEVRKKTVRSFDRFALPREIRDDAAYWRSETQRILTLTPLDSTQKAPSAEMIADTYAETHDLPIGLPEQGGDAAVPALGDYGGGAMPSDLPAPATPLAEHAPPPGAERDEARQDALAAAEAPQGFDFSGVPRYRTGGRSRASASES
jgi:hypothetical protein